MAMVVESRWERRAAAWMHSESAGRSHLDFFFEHPDDDAAARNRELVDDISRKSRQMFSPPDNQMFQINEGIKRSCLYVYINMKQVWHFGAQMLNNAM